MTEPWEDHYRLITPESWRAVSCALRALEEARIRYVLIGGWAFYVYGNLVPSVDTDLFIVSRDFPKLRQFMLEQCGLVPNGKLQVLPLDQPLLLTPRTNAEERGPHSYDPAALLPPERTTERRLRVHGADRRVVVPRAPELGFSKLKALHDRRLAWEAFTDPRVMATLPGPEQARVRRGTEPEWRRKAGKDLFDLAFLLRETTLPEVLSIADRFELRRPLEGSVRNMPAALRDFAESLARKNPQLAVEFP